jgi:putative sterol carrier protein
MTMGQATTDFMEGLGSRGHEPLLETTSGTLRVELVKDGKRTERWLISIDKGDIHVSRKGGKPDCTVRAPEDVFDRIASGETNALAALLRGTMFVDGETRVLVRFQRLFPGPPSGAARKSQPAKRGRKR